MLGFASNPQAVSVLTQNTWAGPVLERSVISYYVDGMLQGVFEAGDALSDEFQDAKLTLLCAAIRSLQVKNRLRWDL